MAKVIPQGKGVWIHQIWNLEGSTIDEVNYDAIVEAIVKAELSHVTIKVADGVFPYNVRWENYPYWSGDILDDFAVKLTERLHQIGILVFGYHYVYGYRPLDEARIGVERVNALNLDGYSIDAESEYKLPGRATAATIYSDKVREDLPEIAISLASYRYPTLHRELPWFQFLRRCDYVTQQLYWESAHNPVQQLLRSLEENDELMAELGLPDLTQCPIGSAYGRGSWRSTPNDVLSFLKACLEKGLLSASLWSYDWMRNPANNALDLWNVLADFEWVIPEPPPGPPIVTIPEWALKIDSWARTAGYTGPRPPETSS